MGESSHDALRRMLQPPLPSGEPYTGDPYDDLAKAIMRPGTANEDFIRLLDALTSRFEASGQTATAEECSDLALALAVLGDAL